MFIERIESRLLLSGNVVTLAKLATSGLAQGGIVVDANGNLFGTTRATNSAYGTIYELPQGTSSIVTLNSFIEAQGVGPNPNLLIDPAGNIFGTIPTGGLSNHGVVFEIPAGKTSLVALASYDGSNGNQLGNGLVMDRAGDLFLLSLPGPGGAGNGAILELPAGRNTLITLAVFPTGLNPVGNPAIDSYGNLFAATQIGGVNNLGAIYELPANNRSALIVRASFNVSDPTPQGDLIADAGGNVFGTTYSTSTGQSLSTVFELPANIINPQTLATVRTFDGSHIEPGLVRDSAGNLFGATYQTFAASTVFEIPSGQMTMNTLATIPEVVNFGVNSNIINTPLAIDSAGNVYGTTADSAPFHNDTIFAIPGAAAPDTPNQIVVVTPPSATVVSTPITPAIVINLYDSNNKLVTSSGAPVSVRIKKGPSGAVLGGTLTVNAVNGVATFDDLTLSEVGNYTLTFSSPSIPSVTTTSFKIKPSPLDGSHLVITPPASAVVAGTKAPPITVTAEDSDNAVSTSTKGKVTLTVSTDSAGTTIVATKTASLKKGVATFKNLSLKKSGTYWLLASTLHSLDAEADSFTVASAPAKKLVFDAPLPPTFAAGTSFSIEVNLVDKFGNVAENDDASVTLSLQGKDPSLLSGVLTQNAVNGSATFAGLSLSKQGHYKLMAIVAAENLKGKSPGFKVTRSV